MQKAKNSAFCLDVSKNIATFVAEKHHAAARDTNTNPLEKEDTMEFQLQTIHFNATEKLAAYIEKKVAKLDKNPDIQSLEITLKIVKPETANNKEADVHVVLPGQTIHVEKIADTFEEAVDHCIDVVKRGLEKAK